MPDKTTLEMLQKAMKDVKSFNTCPECNTTRDYIVMGYEEFYCKHMADRLAVTQQAIQIQKDIKLLFDYKPKVKGKVGKLFGIKVIKSASN